MTRCVVSDPDGSVRIAEAVLHAPGPHELLVKQVATGVCHSQLFEIHRPHEQTILLGHESVGIVVETGPDVRAARLNDKVVVTWLPQRHLLDPRETATPVIQLLDGTEATYERVFTWSDYSIVDEAFVVPVETEARPELAAVVGCAVMTGGGAVTRTLRLGVGESLAVFGVGGVGLSAVAVARILGADPIIAVDVNGEKLDLARELGATHVVDATEVEPADAIRRIVTDDRTRRGLPAALASGVDYALDCSGLPTTAAAAVDAVRPGIPGASRGGLAVLVGVPKQPVGVDVMTLLVDEKSVLGCLGGSSLPGIDIPSYLRWHDDGYLNLDALVTDVFALDQVGSALERLAEGRIRGRGVIRF